MQPHPFAPPLAFHVEELDGAFCWLYIRTFTQCDPLLGVALEGVFVFRRPKSLGGVCVVKDRLAAVRFDKTGKSQVSGIEVSLEEVRAKKYRTYKFCSDQPGPAKTRPAEVRRGEIRKTEVRPVEVALAEVIHLVFIRAELGAEFSPRGQETGMLEKRGQGVVGNWSVLRLSWFLRDPFAPQLAGVERGTLRVVASQVKKNRQVAEEKGEISMKEDNNISPRRAKFACRPRAGRRDLLIASEDIADRAEELRATAKGSASDHIVKACAYRLNRTVIIARERGEISPEEAASYATYGREILESGGHEEPQSIVTESLLLYHLRQNREAAAVDDSIQRLKSLASRLQAKVDDAAKSGPVPPDLSWDASLVWAACARVADLSRDADDALGYVRLAIGLTWQDHPRAYAVYVEVLRRILFERGETVLATALPRIVRTDLG